MGIIAYTLLAWLGARTLSGPDWIGRQAADYVRNVQLDLRSMRSSADAFAFVDGVVPEFVVFPILAPANTVSEVLSVIDEQVVFDVAGRNTVKVTDDGLIQTVVFHSEDGGDVGHLLQQGSLVVSSPTTGPSANGLCVTTDKSAVIVAFTPQVPVGDGDGDLYVALRYSSPSRRALALAVEPVGGGGLGRNQVMMLKDGGEQTNLFPLDGRTLGRLFVGVVPDSKDAQVCLKQIEVGRITAKP